MRGSRNSPEALRLPLGQRAPRGFRHTSGLVATALVLSAMAVAVAPLGSWSPRWARAATAGALVGLAPLGVLRAAPRGPPAGGAAPAPRGAGPPGGGGAAGAGARGAGAAGGSRMLG